MPYAEKFRQKHMRDFEREAAQERSRAMHRLIGTEGFARIDTHCPLCACTGNCLQGRACDCTNGLADEMALYDTPTRWDRFKAWFFNHPWVKRHVIDTMEDHP